LSQPTVSRSHERFFLTCGRCAKVHLEWGPLFASRLAIEALKRSVICLCGSRLEIRRLLLDRPRTAYTSLDLQSMLRATGLRLSANSLRVSE
jgi:hypothetical protein